MSRAALDKAVESAVRAKIAEYQGTFQAEAPGALPTKIDAAESEVARLDALLASPGFYASSSRDMVSETMAASDAARRQVEALMARWEALELRRSSR